jgi:hypothetical protein
MKTNQEIQAEARQLAMLGSQFQNEQRIANASATAVAAPRVLANLTVSVESPGRERRVEAAIVGGALVFRLMERETDLAGADRDERDGESSLVAASASAYDVLRTGYEMAEEDRLTAQLERFADRADPADGDSVAEVEAIVEANLLSPADRLRTKAETVDFIEGRLERSAFIAHVIERQCSRAEGYREHLVERHELKLTVGEP